MNCGVILIYPYRIPPPCHAMDAENHLRWNMRDIVRGGGGLVGIRKNLLNKEWEEMCGAAYKPDVVTYETKIHGVTAAGEAPPTGGRGARRRGTSGYPYAAESEVGSDLHGYMGVVGFWAPCRMCVFGVHGVDTDKESYDGRHPQ